MYSYRFNVSIAFLLIPNFRNLSVPTENRRKEALIKKQIIEDLNTTENPLWIEQ